MSRFDLIVVRDVIGSIVQQVSGNLTSKLKEYDDLITGIHYMAGHPLEIANRLTARTNNGLEYNKYPLIALFQDFEEIHNAERGMYGDVRLNLIIARSTKSDFIADQRYDSNFKPVLYPIYNEFLKCINEYTDGHWKPFQTNGVSNIQHTKIDRLFWGTEQAMKNSANKFNDYIDCIEIRNLNLKITLKNC